MKTFERKIPSYYEKMLFKPLRDKMDYVRVLLNGAQLFLIDYQVDPHSKCKIRLVVDRMNRLFFISESRMYSISFPFSVSVFEQRPAFTCVSGEPFDSRAISAITSIVEDGQFALNPSLVNYYLQADSSDTIGISVLEEIFRAEPGYIRFDHDRERENYKRHPLNHVDINYSTYSTYKIGMDDKMLSTDFEDMLNTLTDCTYLRYLP